MVKIYLLHLRGKQFIPAMSLLDELSKGPAPPVIANHHQDWEHANKKCIFSFRAASSSSDKMMQNHQQIDCDGASVLCSCQLSTVLANLITELWKSSDRHQNPVISHAIQRMWWKLSERHPNLGQAMPEHNSNQHEFYADTVVLANNNKFDVHGHQHICSNQT